MWVTGVDEGVEARNMALCIAVCRKCDKKSCLAGFLRAKTSAEVYPVRCQKICSGSVVGFEFDGRMEWFEHVDSAKAMVALKRQAAGKDRNRLAPSLKKRRVKQRSGRSVR